MTNDAEQPTPWESEQPGEAAPVSRLPAQRVSAMGPSGPPPTPPSEGLPPPASSSTPVAAPLGSAEPRASDGAVLDDTGAGAAGFPYAGGEPPPPAIDGQVPTVVRTSAGEAADAYTAADFEQHTEPFVQEGTEKLGIVGGRDVGKSYLFQAMVYRTYAGSHSGALNYYLKNIRLFRALKRRDRAQTMVLRRFIDKYAAWQKLPTTLQTTQQWYRLQLRARAGWLGGAPAALDVEFFDGSGETFFEAPLTFPNRELWKEGYLEARVMVFCVPLWAVFPDAGLSEEDWETRHRLLTGFEQVVQNYTDVREASKSKHPVFSILALTQADDRRTALKNLQARWIQPYIDRPHFYLKRLQRGHGVARYLANARQVSAALHEEFASARDPRVAAIPASLDFRAGRPWLIPLSAVEGALLEQAERAGKPGAGRSIDPPVPVHVELPLLVALCERDNALM